MLAIDGDELEHPLTADVMQDYTERQGGITTTRGRMVSAGIDRIKARL